MTCCSTDQIGHRDVKGQTRVMAGELPNGSRHSPPPLGRMRRVRSEVLKSIDLTGFDEMLRHPLLNEASDAMIPDT